MPQVISAEYVAGFLDGEGSVSLNITGKKPSNRQQVSFPVKCSNTDEKIIRDLREQYGGSVSAGRPLPKHQPFWVWTIQGAAAAALLREIRPFMRIKHRQADLALEYWEWSRQPREVRCCSTPDRPQWHRTQETLRKEVEFKERMHVLNLRGQAKRVWVPTVHAGAL